MANRIHMKYGNNIQKATILFLLQLIHNKYAVRAIIAKILRTMQNLAAFVSHMAQYRKPNLAIGFVPLNKIRRNIFNFALRN
jgi:hypothetical protein